MVEVMTSHTGGEIDASSREPETEEQRDDSSRMHSRLTVEGLARLILEERSEWGRVLAEDAKRRESRRQELRSHPVDDVSPRSDAAA